MDLAKSMARGLRAIRALASVSKSLLLYRSGKAVVEDVLQAAAPMYAGRHQAEAEAEACKSINPLQNKLDPLGKRLLADLHEQGLRVYVFTVAPQVAAEALLEGLPATGVYGTNSHVTQGRLTGELERPIPYGHGRLEIATALARKHGFSLDSCSYYCSSSGGLPLLQEVGTPLCVNASKRLALAASKEGWPLYQSR